MFSSMFQIYVEQARCFSRVLWHIRKEVPKRTHCAHVKLPRFGEQLTLTKMCMAFAALVFPFCSVCFCGGGCPAMHVEGLLAFEQDVRQNIKTKENWMMGHPPEQDDESQSYFFISSSSYFLLINYYYSTFFFSFSFRLMG